MDGAISHYKELQDERHSLVLSGGPQGNQLLGLVTQALRAAVPGITTTQRAQYPLIKEYNIRALRIRKGFGVYHTIIVIRNPPKILF